MPKYQLIIGTDDPKELQPHIAIMMNGATIFANHIPSGAISSDADDNAPPNPNAPQFDAAGIPWDDRIHSKNKGMTNDGMWRKKRGVADTMVAAVEAELKARGAQPMYMQPPGAPPAPPAYSPPPQGYQPPGPPAPPAYSPPPAYQPPAPPAYSPPPQGYAPPPQGYQPPPPPAPQVGMDFTQFMQHVSAQLPKRDANNQPIMDGNYLASVCQRLSAQTQRPFSAITDLANHPDCIALAVQFMQADGRW